MIERWRSWSGIAIVAGTIFGVGAFGIPYTVAQSGPVMGLFWFGLLAFAVTFLHLLYGSLQLGGNAHKRLINLVGNNLGLRWRFIPFISTFVGGAGAMLAYLIVGGSFAKLFFGDLLNISAEQWTLGIWLMFSVLIFFGIKSVAKFELIATAALFLGVLFLVVIFWQNASISIIPQGSTINFFAPYGVILFSLYGANAIPEMVEFVGGERRNIAIIIILGTLLPLVLYVFFTFGVLGLSGSLVSTDAISGLSGFFDPVIIKIAALVGFLAIATSFVTVGLYLADTLADDLRFPPLVARITAVCIPLILFLAGLRNFITIVGFLGAILGAIDGIIISYIFLKLRSSGRITPLIYTPRFIPVILIVIFLAGILGEIIVLAGK